MRKKNISYQKIGDVFGISRQAVYRIVNAGKSFRKVNEKIIYPGLRQWMNDNNMSYEKLNRLLPNFKYSSTRSYLQGKTQPPKKFVDSVLNLTNMTYEEAFGT